MTDVIEVEIDDGFLERMDERASDYVGDNMLVDAVAVKIMCAAYRERDRLRKDIADIQSGACVVVPKSKAHASAMILVADRYLKDNHQ